MKRVNKFTLRQAQCERVTQQAQRENGIRRGQIIGLIMAVVSVLVAPDLFAATKIDPAFRQIERSQNMPVTADISAKFASVKDIDGETFVGALIKTTDMEVAEAAVLASGGRIITKLKTILSADIPIDAVERIAEMDEVIYVEAAKKLNYKMNYARSTNISNVVDVPDAYNTGSGVVFGLYDSGVDCGNADFKNIAGTATRIAAYREYSSSGYTDYTTTQISDGDCEDSGYHGTHVTGIAAGKNSIYKGVAPEATIVAAEMGTGSETEILSAIAYIFQKAQALSAPAVVNLSVGTSMGPHDNTSNFETGISEALLNPDSSEKEGRAIVCAAGNENVNTNDSDSRAPGGIGGLHATVNVSGADIGYEMITRGDTVRTVNMDVWLAQGGNCNIETIAYTNAGAEVLTTGEIPPGGLPASSSSGCSLIEDVIVPSTSVTASNLTIDVDFSDSDNANNHKQHALVTVTVAAGGSYDSTDLTFDLVFRDKGSGCSGDVWLYEDYVSKNIFTSGIAGSAGPDYTYADGDSNKMVTIPATSTGCIAAASFASRDTYVDIDGTTEDQNVYDSACGGTGTQATDISLFSSLGPGAGTTNTQKPDLAAPGEPIISTLASTVTASDVILGDSTHVKLEGTSMSSPFVAGVAVLMMSKDGCLTASEVKSALTGNVMTTGIPDPASLPNYIWGYGKLDASAAVGAVTETSCVPSNAGDI